MSIATALELTNEQFLKMIDITTKTRSIGNDDLKVETSELPDEPVIYANNEQDREILRRVFRE